MPPARRDTARHRASDRPNPGAVGPADSRQAARRAGAALQRWPDGCAQASNPQGCARLELRVAERARAATVRAALGLRGRLDAGSCGVGGLFEQCRRAGHGRRAGAALAAGRSIAGAGGCGSRGRDPLPAAGVHPAICKRAAGGERAVGGAATQARAVLRRARGGGGAGAYRTAARGVAGAVGVGAR